MSKKRNGNSFWSNGPDSELIARFTGFLKQVLLNERSTYLKNLKKKELNECSFEELEEKGQFQNQFAVDEIENILMWEAIRNYISLLYPRECEVIICLFIHRMTARETASKLGLSEKTVSYYKMTALKKICKALEDTNQ